jgi:hypothetical protein
MFDAETLFKTRFASDFAPPRSGRLLLLALALSIALPSLAGTKAKKEVDPPPPTEQATKQSALATAATYLVKVSRFTVSSSVKPGDTVTLSMLVETSGNGAKDIPWTFSNGATAIANGIERAVPAGKTIEVTATYGLPSAGGMIRLQGTIDPKNTLGEPDTERANNVSQVVEKTLSNPLPIAAANTGKLVGASTAAISPAKSDTVAVTTIQPAPVASNTSKNVSVTGTAGTPAKNDPAAVTTVQPAPVPGNTTKNISVTGTTATPTKNGTVAVATTQPAPEPGNTTKNATATATAALPAKSATTAGTVIQALPLPGNTGKGTAVTITSALPAKGSNVAVAAAPAAPVPGNTMKYGMATAGTAALLKNDALASPFVQSPAVVGVPTKPAGVSAIPVATGPTPIDVMSTAFDGTLGNLFRVHLDSGSAKVSSSEATLDGAITISLKDNTASKLAVTNGHVVLKAAIAGPLPAGTAQTAMTSQSSGNALAVQSVGGNVGLGAAQGVVTGSSGRSWSTLDGAGNITVSLGPRSLPLAGSRSLSGNANALFLGGGPLDVGPCRQDSAEYRLDSSGLSTTGKLTCGSLALEESTIKVATSGLMSGSGKKRLFDHDFVFPYELSAGRLRAHQQASWPATDWLGIGGAAEYRLTAPRIDIDIDGRAVSKTFFTGGLDLRTRDTRPDGSPWAQASSSAASLLLGDDGTVKPTLPVLPSPEDNLKSARDDCKNAADWSYDHTPAAPGKAAVRDAAKALCESNNPFPPALPNLDGFILNVAAVLSGAGQATMQTERQALGQIQNLGGKIGGGVSAAGNAVGVVVDQAARGAGSVAIDAAGSRESTRLLEDCTALIALAKGPAPKGEAGDATKANALAQAQECVGRKGAEYAANAAVSALCTANCGYTAYVDTAEESARQQGRTIALDTLAGTTMANDLRSWMSAAMNSGKFIGKSASDQCLTAKRNNQLANSSVSDKCSYSGAGRSSGGVYVQTNASGNGTGGQATSGGGQATSNNSNPPTPAVEGACVQLNANGTCARIWCNAGETSVNGQCVQCDAPNTIQTDGTCSNSGTASTAQGDSFFCPTGTHAWGSPGNCISDDAPDPATSSSGWCDNGIDMSDPDHPKCL